MSANEILVKVEDARELKTMIEQLQQELEAVQAVIKDEMEKRNTEELFVGSYRVMYQTVVSKRFDTKTFKSVHGDLYKEFTKETEGKRFSIR